MIKLQDVFYVRLGTRDLEGAHEFATDYLGLDVAERTPDEYSNTMPSGPSK